jgi:hypothetical protein
MSTVATTNLKNASSVSNNIVLNSDGTTTISSFSANSGSTAPSVTVAFQDWIDTSGANPLWKKRNAANNAWITIGTIISNTITFEGTLPSQTGNAGEFLTTDGTTASWGAVPPGSSVEVFTSSGTFVKPANGTIAYVQLWGGGGGGGRNQGGNASAGGGGACIHRWFNLSDLASSISVTIGTGGVGTAVNGAGTTGGTSSFGALFSAFGGEGGATGISQGGGGGGSLSAGSATIGGAGHGPMYQGGNGYGTLAVSNGDFGGGGGGGGGGSTPGGSSIWGGGGGRGVGSNTVGELGAVSLHGGNGGTGNNAGAGAAPGGGGGASRLSAVSSGAGARGECRVYVW